MAALLSVAVTLLGAAQVRGGPVAGSKHDLSSSFDPNSDQVCAFCHTPHAANTGVVAPLWNRFIDPSKAFIPYQSATLDTNPSQPAGSISAVCLGCHDGTLGTGIVNGIAGGDKHDLVNAPGRGGIPDTSSYPNCQRCHGEFYGDPPAFWQGLDLGDDHPIAMSYPTAAVDPAFRPAPDPTNGWDDVKLYNGRVECASCHDVHDPDLMPFLRRSNVGSQLCLTCHLK